MKKFVCLLALVSVPTSSFSSEKVEERYVDKVPEEVRAEFEKYGHVIAAASPRNFTPSKKPFSFQEVVKVGPQEVSCLTMAKDGKHVVVGTKNGLLMINLETGKIQQAGQKSPVRSVACGPQGEVYAVFQRTVPVQFTTYWPKDKKILAMTRHRSRDIMEIQVIGEKAFLLDNTWWGAQRSIYTIALSPSGETLAVTHPQSALLVDLKTRKSISVEIPERRGESRGWSESSFSSDGKKVLFSGGAEMDLQSKKVNWIGNLAAYDEKGELAVFTGECPNHNFPSWYNFLHYKGKKIHDTGLWSGGPGRLQIASGVIAWSHFNWMFAIHTKDGNRLVRIENGQDWSYDHIQGLVVTPDGKHIISGCYKGSVKMWDAKSGKLLRTCIQAAK